MDDYAAPALLFASLAICGALLTWERARSASRLPPARDWEYKAEGKHNVVLTYSGSLDAWRGLAVRLRKTHSGDATETVREVHDLFPSGMEEFAERVMIPVLGHEYVDQCASVAATRQTMQAFAARLRDSDGLRPVCRRHSTIDESAASILLMTDSTTVDAPSHDICAALGCASPLSSGPPFVRMGSPIAVEIKPKAGLAVRSSDAAAVAPSPALGAGAPDPRASDTASKFRMQQVWKVSKGKALRASAYCPLDLFHGDDTCRRRALRGLAQTPHNNFRVFARGAPPFPPADTEDRWSGEERSAMRAAEAAAAPGAVLQSVPQARSGASAPAGLSRLEYQRHLAESLEATSIGNLAVGLPGGARVTAPSRAPPSWHGLHESIAHAEAAVPLTAPSAALESMVLACLEREPLLGRLYKAQSLSGDVSSTRLWDLYRSCLEAAAGRSFTSPRDAHKWARQATTLGAQTLAVADATSRDEVGSSGQRFLVAQTACDCSVLLSLQLVWAPGCSGDGAAQATGQAMRGPAAAASFFRELAGSAPCPARPAQADGDRAQPAGAKVAQRALGAFRLTSCAGAPGGGAWELDTAAVEAQVRSALDGTPAEDVSADDVWVLYRFSVVDLEPKLWSRIPKYAAKDAEITAAFAHLVSDPAKASS